MRGPSGGVGDTGRPRATIEGDFTATGVIKGSRLWATGLGTAGVPAVAVGDGDSGFYETSDDVLNATTGAIARTTWSGDAVALFNVVAISLTPTSGAIDFNGPITVDGDMTMGAGHSFNFDPSSSVADCPIQPSGDPNTGFNYMGVDHISVVSAGARMLDIRAAGTFGVNGVVGIPNRLRLGNGAGTQQLLTAADQITSSTPAHEVTVAAGGLTLTSLPSIATSNVAAWDLIYLKNADPADSVTLQDESVLAGSKVRGIGGANVVLGPRDVGCFLFDGVDWLHLFTASL